MLANGATLAYKELGANSDYVDLPGLKEIPEVGSDPEKIEATSLADSTKKYEMGIGDSGDLAYKFKYDNSSDASAYRLMRKAQESGKELEFKETLKDGTVTKFTGTVAVKRGGGGINSAVEFTLNIAVSSDFDVTDPPPIIFLINNDEISVVSVSSQCGVSGSPTESGGGQAEKTLDGNPETYWHSDWQNSSSMPQYITYDLGAEYKLSKIAFLPRQNGVNGDIFEVEVYAYTEAMLHPAPGEMPLFPINGPKFKFENNGATLLNRNEWKEMNLSRTGRRFRLEVVHSGGATPDQCCSMAEIRFYAIKL